MLVKVEKTRAVATKFKAGIPNWWRRVKIFFGWAKPKPIKFIHTVSVVVGNPEQYASVKNGDILRCNNGMLWYVRAKAVINDCIFLLESLSETLTPSTPTITELEFFAGSFQEA